MDGVAVTENLPETESQATLGLDEVGALTTKLTAVEATASCDDDEHDNHGAKVLSLREHSDGYSDFSEHETERQDVLTKMLLDRVLTLNADKRELLEEAKKHNLLGSAAEASAAKTIVNPAGLQAGVQPAMDDHVGEAMASFDERILDSLDALFARVERLEKTSAAPIKSTSTTNKPARSSTQYDLLRSAQELEKRTAEAAEAPVVAITSPSPIGGTLKAGQMSAAGTIRYAIESQLDVLNEHLLEFEDKQMHRKHHQQQEAEPRSESRPGRLPSVRKGVPPGSASCSTEFMKGGELSSRQVVGEASSTRRPLQDNRRLLNNNAGPVPASTNIGGESCYKRDIVSRHKTMNPLSKSCDGLLSPRPIEPAPNTKAKGKEPAKELQTSNRTDKLTERRRRREERAARASKGPTRKEMEAKMERLDTRLARLDSHQQKIYKHINTEQLVTRLEALVTELVFAIRELRSE